MKSSKWLTAIPLALVALAAFAPSAMAAELPGLQQEGKPLPVGRILELKNSEPVTVYDPKFGNVSCNSVVLVSKVVRNEASSKFPFFKTELGDVGSKMEGCIRTPRNGEAPKPFVVSSVYVPRFETTGPASAETGEAPAGMWLSFSWRTLGQVSPSLEYCGLESENLNWSFKPGTSSLTLNRSSLVASPVVCGVGWGIAGRFSASSLNKPVIVN